ncbi:MULTISPECIES: hypothetical protein [Marinobacter]|uniref:hypothetical protein n=1 Tax=Marinobacter TaxID=2742 RepID=UPI0016810538|nr:MULTISPECIES: hypothetical protein [Marinobacter]
MDKLPLRTLEQTRSESGRVTFSSLTPASALFLPRRPRQDAVARRITGQRAGTVAQAVL